MTITHVFAPTFLFLWSNQSYEDWSFNTDTVCSIKFNSIYFRLSWFACFNFINKQTKLLKCIPPCFKQCFYFCFRCHSFLSVCQYFMKHLQWIHSFSLVLPSSSFSSVNFGNSILSWKIVFKNLFKVSSLTVRLSIAIKLY